jgi:hypothetical protein
MSGCKDKHHKDCKAFDTFEVIDCLGNFHKVSGDSFTISSDGAGAIVIYRGAKAVAYFPRTTAIKNICG